jgi:uncharacterized repeat protein (TIGR03803 family)
MICVATAIAAPAQSLTTLFSFDGIDGSNPSARLIQATDGSLYGTTSLGGVSTNCGTYGCGTIFRITLDGTLTMLYSFCAQTGCPDGDGPSGLVQGTDGSFYGTTANGLSNGEGTIFKITSGGALTTLYRFCAQTGCLDGKSPYGGLIQATDGNFYGTASAGGSGLPANCGSDGCGTIFKITPNGALTTLYSFCTQTDCPGGWAPSFALMQATDGNLYGTTFYGASIFRITPAGVLTTIYSFCTQTDCPGGSSPNGGLIQGSDGNLYGTTFVGGTRTNGCNFGCGTVFEITLAGVLTTLHRFDGADGSYSSVGLIQATDGNFYGATLYGKGEDVGYGTIFEITPAGVLATLHRFDGTDGYSGSELVQATDGGFYGTTPSGGTSTNCVSGCGTVFRLAATPAVTLTPPSVNFSNQALNQTSAPKGVGLKNSGTSLLVVGGVTITGSGFAISADTCSGATLRIGKLCKVSITFTPTVPGKVTGTLAFTDNASNSPQTAPLSGTGAEPATLLPASVPFGPWTVGTTSTAKTFTLANNQSVALTSVAISTTGDFAVSATTCTASLAAKAKCTIGVTFTPTETGTRTGKLSVSDSASYSPQTSSLTGTGK